MSFFKKLTLGLKKSSSKLSGGISDIFTLKKIDVQTLEELEELLITSDIGVKTSVEIINEFSKKRLKENENPADELAKVIADILKPCEKKLEINHHPHIILMVGVNGAGKTTTIGKLSAKFADKKVSLIAGDTFRAAAVEQLKEWGARNKIRVFSGAQNCDAAGLIYDGIAQAIKEKDDIVFIDTAGRLQNKSHLMDELKKIIKVIKKIIPEAPHSTLLTLDATTGQNAVEQVKVFKEMVDVSGLVITKLDGTSKGGVLIGIANEYQLPIHYIGIGECIDDLDEFNAEEFSRGILGLS